MRPTFARLWGWTLNVSLPIWTIRCGAEFSAKMESKEFDSANLIPVWRSEGSSNICWGFMTTATSWQSPGDGAARETFRCDQSKLAGKGSEHSGDLGRDQPLHRSHVVCRRQPRRNRKGQTGAAR